MMRPLYVSASNYIDGNHESLSSAVAMHSDVLTPFDALTRRQLPFSSMFSSSKSIDMSYMQAVYIGNKPV